MSRFAWCLHEAFRLAVISGLLAAVVLALFIITPERMPS